MAPDGWQECTREEALVLGLKHCQGHMAGHSHLLSGAAATTIISHKSMASLPIILFYIIYFYFWERRRFNNMS